MTSNSSLDAGIMSRALEELRTLQFSGNRGAWWEVGSSMGKAELGPDCAGP